jgi:hypothetical protein
MTTPIPRWVTILAIGVVLCALAGIAVSHRYSLKVTSYLVDLEMRPPADQKQ